MEQAIPWQKWIQEGQVSIPVILLKNYSTLGINETECMMLIHIHAYIEKGNAFPTPEELSRQMTLSSSECFSVLQRLIKKGVLGIDQSSVEDVREESYSLLPLWNTIMNKLTKEQQLGKLTNTMQAQTDLYTLFEQEFGRPLSPLECETLAMWIDKDNQSPTLIKAALREAVISTKLNFRYIDRILFEWKKQGIETVEQARKQGEKFRQPQKQEPLQDNPVTKKVPFYNWLEK